MAQVASSGEDLPVGAAPAERTAAAHGAGHGRWRVTPSGLFGAALAVFMAWMLMESGKWPEGARLMPRTVAVIGLLMLLGYAVQSLVLARPSKTGRGQIMDIGRLDTGQLTRGQVTRRIGLVVGSTIGLVAAIWTVGFHVSIPAYVFLALVTLGRVRWWKALLTAAFFLALLLGLYDRVIHITWHTTLLEQLLGTRP